MGISQQMKWCCYIFVSRSSEAALTYICERLYWLLDRWMKDNVMYTMSDDNVMAMSHDNAKWDVYIMLCSDKLCAGCIVVTLYVWHCPNVVTMLYPYVVYITLPFDSPPINMGVHGFASRQRVSHNTVKVVTVFCICWDIIVTLITEKVQCVIHWIQAVI